MKKNEILGFPHRSSRGIIYAQSALNVSGSLIALWGWKSLPTYPVKLWVAATVVTGIVTYLFARYSRQKWTKHKTSMAFALNLLPVFAMTWSANEGLLQFHPAHVTFQVYHLSAMTVAILAPPSVWTGLAGILTFLLLNLFQISKYIPSNVAELHITAAVAFGVFSLVLFIFRLQGRSREEEIARIAEREFMTEKLVKTLLAVQDLVNSPIQTLRIDTKLIRTKPQNLNEVCERIERSIEKLEHLNDLVAKETKDLSISPNWDISLDDQKQS